MSSDLSIGSELLLELYQRFGSQGQALVLGGEAALANTLEGQIVFAPTDVRERDTSTVPISIDPRPDSASTVLIPAPPDRDLLRRELLVAASTARPEARVLLCGPNAAGGKSAVKDATDLLGTPIWSGYREKHRMAIFTRGDLRSPFWASEPGVQPDTWRTFIAETPVGEINLSTQAGVFAGAKVDAGTSLLLEHLRVQPGSSILDIGCGAGILGIVAAKQGANVTMSDANLLAVAAANHNVAQLGLEANIVASDAYQHLEDSAFDLIVSNPPFHRGKQVDFSVANEIINGAAERLNQGGSLLIVANAFLAYGKQMADVFTRVDTIAATPQYHVIRGTIF